MRLTLGGKPFVTNPERPGSIRIRTYLDKSKLGTLFENREVCRAVSCSMDTLGNQALLSKPLRPYWAMLRYNKRVWGKPATIKQLKILLREGPK